MTRTPVLALATAVVLGWSSLAFAANADPADACVVVDTDMDIDDLMTIPMVVGARHVAAIVTTEGYTLPALGASAVSRLVAEPGQRRIPVIVGAAVNRPEADIAETFGDYVLVFRKLMNRLNNFLPAELPPTPASDDFVRQISDAASHCSRVDILLIGGFTSFRHYGPALRAKTGRVVITGRPAEGDPELEAGESFNCVYDRPSCETVFGEQLPGLDHTYVDVPRGDCDTTPNRAGCVGTVYGPTLAMVHRLGPVGLPNTLRQILLGESASWAVDTWEQSGYGGRTMFWDQSTALALLEPDLFRPVGAHVETVLSPADFADRWAALTNLSATYA
ncbi:nucleoside hydrolase [Mycolicibacterium flavescens]|uniref:Inosine/uridine-preferring nucleoside hydrolase domain-containing protein n=1 Tax=Mycolicibacterium flavescens TaxID=1776 RepID=A0A1E3RNW1_MYCFV|nr:nucleoside hydrolase [Mycolicibacterium flavescens]MCV7278287.1 nucleoside hydrolase [Mycolicibacterium flavescens]ODQ91539.1 hypothetical protein BHQ18_05500 [Mycolicibacterium flavescens]